MAFNWSGRSNQIRNTGPSRSTTSASYRPKSTFTWILLQLLGVAAVRPPLLQSQEAD
jgi:hypothetical protein